MSEILRRLADHTVAFLRIEGTPKGRDATLLGSGTLVVIGNTFAILTAHHVIEALPSSGRLGILLSPTHEPHSIDRPGLGYLKIARGNVDAVGPDLGAVLLARSIASSIAAKKTFTISNGNATKFFAIRRTCVMVYGLLMGSPTKTLLYYLMQTADAVS